MGLAYGAGNLGKFIGPAGLALIAGSSNLVQWHAALGYFAEAPRLAEQTEARWFQAETVRLNGDLLVAMGDRTGVEASYREAIAITQQQSAKLWELRTAARPGLARLWRDGGKRAQAHALLAPVYDRFTEGRDRPVLQEAKMLLDELA
jgi:predicted ATPase